MNTNRAGFRAELETLINKHSKENGSNTPDFILSDYMADCLAAYDKAVNRRTEWYRPEQKQSVTPFTISEVPIAVVVTDISNMFSNCDSLWLSNDQAK